MKKILILQIDGLSHRIFQSSLEQGYLPFLQSLLKKGYHHQKINCGLPSTTPASQIKLFYGLKDLIPAFRFYNKALSKVTSVSSTMIAVLEKEAAARNPRPLLEKGVGIMSIFSGGSDKSMYLGMRDMKNRSLGSSIFFFLNPFRNALFLLKIMVLFIISREERKKHGKDYVSGVGSAIGFIHRTLEELLTSEWAYFLLKKEIRKKTNPIYANFFGYDEIAHHYKPDGKAALLYLSIIDLYIKGCLEEAQRTGAEYELVVLSDHGQTPSISLKRKYGYSLGEKLRKLYPEAIISEQTGEKTENRKGTELMLLCSGGLGLLYDIRSGKKMEKSEWEKVWPGMTDKISRIPGVGFILMRNGGKRVVVKNGEEMQLNTENAGKFLEYTIPEDYPMAIGQLKTLLEMENSGDMLIFSQMLEKNLTVGFEEQAGIHGGLGGEQTEAFFMSREIRLPEKVEDLSEVYKYLYEYVGEGEK